MCHKKVYDVLLIHDNAAPHTNMHTTEAITKFEWTVLLHVPHSPNLAPSDFHLFVYRLRGTAEHHVLMAVEEGEQLLLGRNMCSYSVIGDC